VEEQPRNRLACGDHHDLFSRSSEAQIFGQAILQFSDRDFHAGVHVVAITRIVATG
jgi:hypothetical protein